jgi:ABC-type lipoprotein release transport system permease subunit
MQVLSRMMSKDMLSNMPYLSGIGLNALLFGVRPWDVPTLVAVAMVLGISALLASYVPARRAASVNPVEALRAE